MPALTDVESKLFSAKDFRLENGEILPVLELAYETYGTLNAKADNAVLVESVAAGRLLFQGAGAGGAPTACAVLGDVSCFEKLRSRKSTQRHMISGPGKPSEATRSCLFFM